MDLFIVSSGTIVGEGVKVKRNCHNCDTLGFIFALQDLDHFMQEKVSQLPRPWIAPRTPEIKIGP